MWDGFSIDMKDLDVDSMTEWHLMTEPIWHTMHNLHL